MLALIRRPTNRNRRAVVVLAALLTIGSIPPSAPSADATPLDRYGAEWAAIPRGPVRGDALADRSAVWHHGRRVGPRQRHRRPEPDLPGDPSGGAGERRWLGQRLGTG